MSRGVGSEVLGGWGDGVVEELALGDPLYLWVRVAVVYLSTSMVVST